MFITPCIALAPYLALAGPVIVSTPEAISKNVSNFLKLMNFEDKKKSVINKNDEIIKATLICSAGKNLIK